MLIRCGKSVYLCRLESSEDPMRVLKGICKLDEFGDKKDFVFMERLVRKEKVEELETNKETKSK